MKKYLLITSVCVLFAAQANAFDSSPYVSAKLKYSIMDNSFNSKATFDSNTQQGYVMSYSDNSDIDDKVFGGSVALGAKIPLNFGSLRAEIEYSRNSDAKKTHSFEEQNYENKLESQSFLLNAYYDFDTKTAFIPYVGAGVGFARLKGSQSYENGADVVNLSHTNTVWQIGAGIAYNVNENVAVDLGYRYIDYGDLSKSSSIEGIYNYDEYYSDKIESKAYEIMLGLRYTF